MTTIRNLVTMTIVLLGGGIGVADMPISGMPVTELAQFDDMVVEFMEANDISGGLLAIMSNGVIVYQRGFGWKDEVRTIPLRHDALMRIASINKPFTAAAIRKLIAANQFGLGDEVFDLGQPGGGLLPYSAFDGSDLVQYPNEPTPEMEQITVEHILSHASGLPPNFISPDPMFDDIAIADAFEAANIAVTDPPGTVRTTEFVLGGTLESNPGAQIASPPADCGDRLYSNVAFMILGEVVTTYSGMLYIDYIRQEVVSPIDWLPLNEVVYGRTFEVSQDPRECWYDHGGADSVTNVFDPDGPEVPKPYGGWDHEKHYASGGLVTTTSALVKLADTYYIQMEDFCDAVLGDFGEPTNGARPTNTRSHNGRLTGTSSYLRQRPDGVNYALIFNKRLDDSVFFAPADTLDAALDAGGITWPKQGVEGQWVDFDGMGYPFGTGSYEEPWRFLGIALANSPDEATLNFKPGTSSWTGIINQRVRLRAPQGGVAVIGEQ